MNSKGFSLVEMLAVVAILGLVIGISTFSVTKVRESSLKKIVETKYNDLIGSAILYGQNNMDLLDGKCGDDDDCFVVTVKELVNNGYFKTDEVDSNGEKVVLNNYTNKSMMCDTIKIYLNNNRVNAKMLDKNSESESFVCN